MTEIYIVRHCEAQGNLKRLFQGVSDFDITETGAKQLEYLKKRFENIHLDKIYASPLIRTRKTALAVAGGRDIEIKDEPGMIELRVSRLKKPLIQYPVLPKRGIITLRILRRRRAKKCGTLTNAYGTRLKELPSKTAEKR